MGTAVFVDGTCIPYVTEVDPMTGKVVALRLGNDGKPVVDRSGKDFIKDHYQGQVTLIFPVVPDGV